MRVYFDHEQDKYTPYEQPTRPTRPVSIKSHNKFEVSVNTSHLPAGWYWTAFRASLKGPTEGTLRRLIFDFTSTKIKTDASSTEKYTWSTVVAEDEIAIIPKNEFLTMRLHHQIEIIPEFNLTISITVETVRGRRQDVVFELYHFELTCYDFVTEEHVLWGENKPDEMIRIKAEVVGSDGGPIAIEAYDFSDTGKLAVTMYFTDEVTSNIDASRINRVAHIDVWDLSAPSQSVSTDDPRPATQLWASTTHSVPVLRDFPEDDLKEAKAIVNISSTGAQIVMARGCVKAWKLATPFLIFRLQRPEGPDEPSKSLAQPQGDPPEPLQVTGQPQGDPSEPLTLTGKPQEDPERFPKATEQSQEPHRGPQKDAPQPKKTTVNRLQDFIMDRLRPKNPVEHSSRYKPVTKTCQSLQAHFGYGAFHNTQQDDPNSENERYFKFCGSTFDVYSTHSGWKQLHSLTFGIKGGLSIPEDMYALTQSLRGRYFAWTGKRGAVSIWDFEAGKSIATIWISKNAKGDGAAFSEDGSLVAISLNGSIQVHDVVSGIKLGVHRAKQKEANEIERTIGQDYFMALDTPSLTILTKNKYALNDLRGVFRQYGVDNPFPWNPIFSYRQGATLNIKRLNTILSHVDVDDCGSGVASDPLRPPIDLCYNRSGMDRSKRIESNEGNYYKYSFETYPRKLTITIESVKKRENRKSGKARISLGSAANCYQYLKEKATISLGPAANDYHGFFMTASSQVVLIMHGVLQVWQLLSTVGLLYELVHVEAFAAVSKSPADDTCIIQKVQAYERGHKFAITIEAVQSASDPRKQEIQNNQEKGEAKGDQEKEEVRADLKKKGAKDDVNDKKYIDDDQPQILTFPRAARETFLVSERHLCERGVASLLNTYAESDSLIKDAIVRYLIKHIRPSSKKHVSSLVILCRIWDKGSQAEFEEIIATLLPRDVHTITWIPDNNATKKEDPLSILTKTAKRYPTALTACKTIMEYCVDHAVESKNMTFLFPFLRNLKKIMALCPAKACDYLVKMASISLNDSRRDNVIKNSTVAHSPWQNFQLWNTTLGLDKAKDQVMRLNETKQQSPVDTTFQDYIITTIVHFSLWQVRHLKMTILSADTLKDLAKLHTSVVKSHASGDWFDRNIFVAAFDALWHYKDIGERKDIGECKENDTESTADPDDLMSKVSEIKNFQKKVSREQRPAAKPFQAAEMDHEVKKTQKTTWWKVLYHMFRLKLHLRTHNFVTCHNFKTEFFDNSAIAALVEYKWNTIGYAYWAFRFTFQCVFYGLVIAAALLQVYHERVGRPQLVGVFIAIIVMGAAYLWLELLQAIRNFKRYSRTMYNLVDIIAYSLPICASIYMLVTLYSNNSAAHARSLSFSVVTIFYHMIFELRIYKSVCKYGGRFDPVADELGSSNWDFHLMLGVYFFFTVIVMLNVLIALINKAFQKGDDAWRRDWIEARLHYIEIAENLSYHVPGFRDTYDWFPKEIYFSSKVQDELAKTPESKPEVSNKNDSG
ncbi:hypothetical protein EC968_006838 [Mortierella alpina]|nr:hypothetical protein EC968_006838 [Mortierella alpina]